MKLFVIAALILFTNQAAAFTNPAFKVSTRQQLSKLSSPKFHKSYATLEEVDASDTFDDNKFYEAANLMNVQPVAGDLTLEDPEDPESEVARLNRYIYFSLL